MTEPSLAIAIDKAGEQRAKEIMKNIKLSVLKSLESAWRPKGAGEEFIGDDVKAVLRALSQPTSYDSRTLEVAPSKELIQACRAKIINDLLKGLPNIRELTEMAERQLQPTE